METPVDVRYVPPLRSDGATPSTDGLCHAYSEYEGFDCVQPLGHEGNHGDPGPRR